MKPVGGRGKVAQGYKSTHVRIPDVLKDRVEQLKEQFFNGSLGYADELITEDHRLANEYRKLLTSNSQNSSFNQKPLTDLEDELDEEVEEDVEPGVNEVIKTQVKIIQRLTTDVKLLERELEKEKEKLNSLTSLDSALNLAKEILKQKVSARESLAKMLSFIYSTNVKSDNLK
jgi:vacuolar-type H+-ATPase subunit I/STV1